MKLIKPFFIFVCLVVANILVAEVFRWVDDDGNVHFGDRPQDAVQGEIVDVKSVNTLEGGAELAKRAEDRRANEMEAQRQANARAAKNRLESDQSKPSFCESGLAYYRQLTGYNKNGPDGRSTHYLVDENGKAITESDQTAKIEAMRQRLEARGCL